MALKYRDHIIEDAVSKAAKELADQIDWEIMAGFYTEIGWTRVERSPFVNNKEAVDIRYWIDNNCKGNVSSRGFVWLFENEQDAMMFLLMFGK